MIDWKLYNLTNKYEYYRLIKIEQDQKKSLDKIIMWLTFIVLIAFVVFKERV